MTLVSGDTVFIESAARYCWKPGSHFKVSAEETAATLKRIKKREGEVTIPLIVEEARKKSSPIHPAFEWDRDKNHEEHLLCQARELARHLAEVFVPKDGGPEILTRALINVSPSRYEFVETVLRDVDMTKDMLEDAKRELRAFRAKYAILTQLATVFRAIDTILD